MRTARIFMLAAGLCLGSSACYYTAPFPLSQPVAAPADQSLLGLWRTVLKGDTFFLSVLRFDTATYLAHVFALQTDPDTVVAEFKWDEHCCDLYFRAFPAQIADVRFMNLQQIGTEARAYMFFRYTVEGNVLRVRGLKEDMKPSGTSAEQLRSFLRMNLENPQIYDEWIEFTRISPLFKPRSPGSRLE